MGKNGKYIVLEGQGFTGKTEQAKLLVERLNSSGIKAVEISDIGGIPSTKKIREELLKRRAEGTITSEEEIELFYKSRAIQLEEFTKPNLQKGIWVISTRFSPSTLVYQGVEGGVDLDFIEKLDKKIIKAFTPDLYILLDVPPDEILKRKTSLGVRPRHSFNELNGQVIKKRREAYLEIAKNGGDNWEIIEGKGPIPKIHQKIWEVLQKRFNLD